jgi:hypothetical protein
MQMVKEITNTVSHPVKCDIFKPTSVKQTTNIIYVKYMMQAS